MIVSQTRASYTAENDDHPGPRVNSRDELAKRGGKPYQGYAIDLLSTCRDLFRQDWWGWMSAKRELSY